MMNKINGKLITLLGLTSFVVIGCNKSENTKLATVGGETITSQQLRDHLQTKATVRVANYNQQMEMPVVDTLAFQGLEDLITQQVLLQLAKEEGIDISDKDISDEIEFRKKLHPKVIDELVARGLSTEQIRKNIKLDLAHERLLTKGATYTIQEADKYIKEHPKDFIVPETVHLHLLFVTDSEAQKRADLDLSKGDKFEDVAVRHNVHPESKQTRAKLPPTPMASLPKDVQVAVRKAGPQKCTGWLKMGNGYARFYVDQIQPEKSITLDEAQKEKIRRQLAVQRGSQATDLSKRLMKKFKEAKIEITAASFKEPWKRLEERVREADRINTTSITPKSTETKTSQPTHMPKK